MYQPIIKTLDAQLARSPNNASVLRALQVVGPVVKPLREAFGWTCNNRTWTAPVVKVEHQ